jgi:ribosomal protein S12 methylthiotransferase
VDTLIINTCAFIESAKMEAIDNILEFARLKEEGRLKKIIVAGCLAQRYGGEILKELPEVDGIVGCGSFSRNSRGRPGC